MLPSGWDAVEAQDICERISVGIVVKPKDYYVPEGEGIRAFRSANVREGFIEDGNWTYISEEGHRKNKKSILRTGDVLVVRTGYPGTACVVTPEYDGTNCIDLIFARPDKAKVLPEFLCEFTNSEYGKKQVLDGQGGLAQQHFNVGAFNKLKVPLPPLPEQRKIADILSTWDRAIETTEALLASARTQKRALMQSLLTGKRRFPGFEGQQWKEVRLGDVADIRMGSSPKSSAYNQDGVGLPLIQGNADIRNGRTFPRSFTSEVTTTCEPGDILLSVRAPVGTVAISEHTACVGRGAAVILPRAGTSWLWLKHLMLALEAKWTKVSQGSTFDAVNSKDIKAFAVSTPNDTAEQDRLGEVLEVAEQEILSLLAQIEKLRTEKQALMQQLLTGKRRVVV